VEKVILSIVLIFGFLTNLYSQEYTEKYLNDGYDLLYMADSGAIAEVRRLVEKDSADVNFVNEDGITALMFSAQAGNDSIVVYLLSKGADVNVKSSYFKFSPLISAVKNDFLRTAEILIRNGAIIDDQDIFQRTALHYSTMYGFDTTTDMLLYYGASTEITDVVGYTPLCYAVEEKFDTITNMLLQYDAQTDVFVKDSFDIFQIAAGAGNLYFLEKFRNDITFRKNNDSLTAVDVSVVAGYSEILQWFLSNGFELTDTINGIYTARTLARSSGDHKTKKIIQKMEIADVHYPYLRRVGLGYDMIFNGDDFFMSLAGVITEDRYGFSLETGFLFRPGERRILFPIARDEFYQLRESRTAWYFSVIKNVKLFNVGVNSYLSIFGGIRGAYYWGEHDGFTTPVLHEFITSPLVGINYHFNEEFGAYFYCDYLNLPVYETSPLFYSLGFKALVDFRRKEKNEKYKYIIRY